MLKFAIFSNLPLIKILHPNWVTVKWIIIDTLIWEIKMYEFICVLKYTLELYLFDLSLV